LVLFILGIGLGTGTPAQPAPAEAAGGSSDSATIAIGDQISLAFTSVPASLFARGRIAPGDRLGLVLHIGQPDPAAPYRLEPGDKLAVQFTYGSEIRPLYVSPGEKEDYYLSPINRLYTVQPDGALRMVGLKAPVAAAGRTLDELTTEVERLYLENGILQIPDVSISIEQRPDLRHQSIREILRSGGDRPASFLSMPVPADGFLSFPVIGSVLVAGRAIDDVGASVTEEYRRMGYARLTVNVFFEQIADPAGEREPPATVDKTVRMEVDSSGVVKFPLLGLYRIEGMAPIPLSEGLTDAYRRRGLEAARVTVIVERRAAAPPAAEAAP
jgi:protein involved in polysaccharide export with SLBB domain